MKQLASVADRESLVLAPYAMHSVDSVGRQHDEPSHAYRGCYQRDRDRITHSAAFRRLSRKTQVFTGDVGDYHRTRLTHTLEVASIARTIARALRLNEDLVEALALAHDIGHPPFGHAGEDVLNHCLADDGGFNHNQQAVRVCERLESRYPNFPGLNLSHEVLAGQRYRIRENTDQSTPLLEVQVVDVADSIAYDAHDADDALEMGLLEIGQLQDIALWCEAARVVDDRFGPIDELARRRSIVRQLIDEAVSEILTHTCQRLASHQPQSAHDIRQGPWLVAPSPEYKTRQGEFEAFLFARVYRHPRVVAHREQMGRALAECFDREVLQPERLPQPFARIVAEEGVPRAVGDYLSSLTDRGLLELHEARDTTGTRTTPGTR